MFAFLILSLIGCAPTCEDIEGAVCADDAQALQDRIDQLESAGTAYAWFDQDGVQVTDGPELVWFDDDGVLWQVDVDQGIPVPMILELSDVESYFAEADCSGAPLRRYTPAPLVAFWEYDPRDNIIPALVRDANSAVLRIVPLATEWDGRCDEYEGGFTIALVPAEDIQEKPLPTMAWVPPIYPQAL